GDVKFTGSAGGLTVTFSGFARLLPVIAPNGAVNAASFQVGPGMAPGSYISLFGTGLSDFTDGAASLPLTLSIDSASVSFDVPSANLSLPGRLIYVSPGPGCNQPPPGAAAAASPLSHTLTLPTATIAGQAATVQFSGLAPGFPGLYQVNVEVPAGVPSGVQPVVLKINGVTSPAANLPVQ